MFQEDKAKVLVFLNNIIGFLQIAVGGFLSFIFGIGLMGELWTTFGPKKTTGIGEALIILIIFILFVSMLMRGLRRRRLNRIYCTYMQQLLQYSNFSIERLAHTLRMPMASLRKDLDFMIKKGFIDNINIYGNDFNRYNQDYGEEKAASASSNVSAFRQPKVDEYVEVNCHNCGASNKVLKGSAVNCEYCGSMIKGD